MASIVVLYESKYGQSEKIARHIATLAKHQGHASMAWRCAGVPSMVLRDSDALVVVAPVYYGCHHAGIESLLRGNASMIAERPTAFVSVSAGAASPRPAVRAGARRMAHDFLEHIGCKPDLVLTAGGAVSYPEYGRTLRLASWIFSAFAGGPVDTSRIHESTDWAALDAALLPFFDALRAADEALRRAERRPGRAGPEPLGSEW